MIRAVLFDLDNTLIDFMAMKRACVDAAISGMRSAGLRTPREKAVRRLFALYYRHGLENQRIFQRFLKQETGRIDYAILAKGVIAYKKVKEGFLYPYPNVADTLAALRSRGYRLGIVTDAPRMQAWMRLAAMNLERAFDFVVTFEDTGKHKPSALSFAAALKKLKGVAPSEILFVGDSLERDVKGASRAGMKTALAKYGEVRLQKGPKPDYVLKDVSDLKRILH